MGLWGKVRWGLRIALVRLRFIGLMIASALLVAYWDTFWAHVELHMRPAKAPDMAVAPEYEFYCPMHPNVVRAEPGNCPICGMPLSRRKKGAGEAKELPEGVLGRVQLTPYRIALAGVATVAVERRALVKKIETVGLVEFDERRLARISARVRGRIDKLYVDFTGTRVSKGERLALLYSPELFSIPREFEAARAIGPRSVEDTRTRLRLLGLSPEEIARLEEGRLVEHVEIPSPISGTVVEKRVLSGQYVEEGETLFTVADLDAVWIVAKVYEDEMAWVSLGLPVEVATIAYPGRTFAGHVSFVDPLLDPETRTVRVRIDVANPKGELKPGMYATVRLAVPFGAGGGGRAAEARAPGGGERSGAPTFGPSEEKVVYWCPMHPELTRDAPGTCERCGGMHLEPKKIGPAPAAAGPVASGSSDVEAEYACPVHPDEVAQGPRLCERTGIPYVRTAPQLVVPLEAVIDTGSRKIAYRESAPGIFDAVEVETGPRVGGWYPVLRGLRDGDRVVARGAFLLDAEQRLSPAATSGYFGATTSERAPGPPHASHGTSEKP